MHDRQVQLDTFLRQEKNENNTFVSVANAVAHFVEKSHKSGKKTIVNHPRQLVDLQLLLEELTNRER